jgi:hypothetical protein
VRHRNTGGVKLIDVTEGEYVVDVAPVGEAEDETSGADAPETPEETSGDEVLELE